MTKRTIVALPGDGIGAVVLEAGHYASSMQQDLRLIMFTVISDGTSGAMRAILCRSVPLT